MGRGGGGGGARRRWKSQTRRGLLRDRKWNKGAKLDAWCIRGGGKRCGILQYSIIESD